MTTSRLHTRTSAPLALSVLPFLALGVPAAQAATLGPSNNIQAAIDAAQPGETVTLLAGQYAQGFSMRDGISVVGAGIDSTVITGTITVPAQVAGGTTLASLTGRAMNAAGTQLTVRSAAFTDTVYFEGSGASEVLDSTFRWYVVGRGGARVHFLRSTAEQAAFSWEQAQVAWEDSRFDQAADLSGSSRTSFLRSTTRSIFVVGDARATLDQVSSESSLTARGHGRADVANSQLGGVNWEENGFVSLAGSSVSHASITISAGVAAALVDVGPGLVAAGSASSATGFGASITDSQINTLGLDVSGGLTMTGGGFNHYAILRSGATAAFHDVTTANLMRLLGSSHADLVGGTQGADIEVWEQSALGVSATNASAGTIFVKDDADLTVTDGAHLTRVNLAGGGTARVGDASIDGLILEVDADRSASIDGLVPGLSTGTPVLPGAGGSGPTLELNAATLSKVQLWVRGDADIAGSSVNDYAVVEGEGEARFQDSKLTFVGLFRGSSKVDCRDCRVASLGVFASARATFHGGVLEGYNDLRESGVVAFEGSEVRGLTEAAGDVQLRFHGAVTTGLTRLLGASRAEVDGASDLNELRIEATGGALIRDSRVRTLRFEVYAGHDLLATGFRYGVLSAAFGSEVKGPWLDASSVQVDTTAVLSYGSVRVQDSALNGYTWMYPGAQSVFERTALDGVTVLQTGSQNRFVDSAVTGFFEANGSTSSFEATTFGERSSISLTGSSNNTFTRCTFERGIALNGESINNFGDLASNPGDNDFSRVSTGYKLANFTVNNVKAFNNLWGPETAAEVAATILDQADDAQYGRVEFDPFKVRNRPPVVSAGDDRIIASNAQEGTVLTGSAVDPDGDALLYRWLEGEVELWPATLVDLLSGAATLDLALAPYLEDGEHRITLEVTEPGGRQVTDTVLLVVNNSAPVAVPTGSGSYALGDPILLGGEVADYDGDTLSYTWWWGDEPLLAGTVQTVKEGTPVLLPDVLVPRALPLGAHQLVLEVDDGTNLPTRAAIQVEVVDIKPPTLSPVAEPSILWPPNGKMRDVRIETYAMDASGRPVTLSATVSSNEGVNRKDPDWTKPVIDQATGRISLKLRAERNARGSGRTYVISVTAVDPSGNRAVSQVQVTVPRWGWWQGGACD